MPNDWYIKINNTAYGPLASDKLKQLAQQGKVTPDTPLRNGPSGNWVPAGRLKGLQFSASTSEPEFLENPVVVLENPEVLDGSPPPESSRMVANISLPKPGPARLDPTPKPISRQRSATNNVTPQPVPSQETEAEWHPLDFMEPPEPEPLQDDPLAYLQPAESDVPESSATKSCPFCGEEILSIAKKCKHCGEFLASRSNIRNRSRNVGSDKRILPLFLLWFFLGGLGAHSFYAGRIAKGLIYCVLALNVVFLAAASFNLPERRPPPLGFGEGSPVAAASFAVPDQRSGVAVVLLIALSAQGISLLVDLIGIVTGAYKDGNGKRITKWT